MQTSIEWLQDKLKNEDIWTWEKIQEWFEQSKEMHRNEILDAYMARMDITDKEYFKQIIGMEYYNETFKKD